MADKDELYMCLKSTALHNAFGNGEEGLCWIPNGGTTVYCAVGIVQ